MSITHAEILHLAELSGISLAESELDSLVADLDRILGYVSQLDELDVSGIEPTYQVFEMENIWRPDEITEFEADRKALLSLSPEIEDNQIKVPKVL